MCKSNKKSGQRKYFLIIFGKKADITVTVDEFIIPY